MSRADRSQHPADGCLDRTAGRPANERIDSARVAEDIGTAALDLAKRARDAGLTTVGYLLESVALEAGAEAVARQWPTDQ
jgi:hypothetical protein